MGGTIEIAPCSRVGHVFRSWSPYKIGEEEINHNLKRVGEVWMDEFKYLVYARWGQFDTPYEQRFNVGDLSERKALRNKLNCQSFRWFLDHIAAGQLPYHDLVGAGEIRNPANDVCLDKNDRTEFMDHAVDIYACHHSGGFQYWWYTKSRHIMRDYMCLGVDANRILTVTH